MAKHPALPLWTDAYLADTTHLSDAEHGVYLLLIMHAWRTPDCRLPNDEKWLARKMGRTVEQYRETVLPVLEEFWKCDGNFWTQKKLLHEYRHVKKTSKLQSARVNSRWKKEKGVYRTDTEPIPESEARYRSGNTSSTSTTTSTNKESIDGESESVAAREAADAAHRRYAWEGKVIRLTQADFAKWERAFAHLDLEAELVARDAWLAEQDEAVRKKWFPSTATHLANRNARAKAAESQTANGHDPPKDGGGPGAWLTEDEERQVHYDLYRKRIETHGREAAEAYLRQQGLPLPGEADHG